MLEMPYDLIIRVQNRHIASFRLMHAPHPPREPEWRIRRRVDGFVPLQSPAEPIHLCRKVLPRNDRRYPL
jgi:hypothetical protein